MEFKLINGSDVEPVEALKSILNHADPMSCKKAKNILSPIDTGNGLTGTDEGSTTTETGMIDTGNCTLYDL